MKPFEYIRAEGIDEAGTAAAGGATLIAGGTNLLDLMKLQVAAPGTLVDIGHVPGLGDIEETAEGLRIGALVTNSALAADPRVRKGWPVLSRAILSGASGQIRNRATTAGNLLQRTRCPYFQDPASPCNKREPGSGCPAKGGVSRMTAILGTSENCIAAHPSDMAVAMTLLEAEAEIRAAAGTVRHLPLGDLYRVPGDQPDEETTLQPGEIITAVHVPHVPAGSVQAYRKVRDRASYAFALVSVAGIVRMEEGRMAEARLAFGGVGTKPWHDAEADALLTGRRPSEALFGEAAQLVLAGARTEEGNAFKVPLLSRTMKAVLRELTGAAPASPGTDRTEAYA
ncbi:xanthine dehydrogenase family protein subunit M [Mangrovicoccus sp. HB161399]|uniref:FAD binding domain-containing protein n=1 Tax=Mangrovicoccus sp. HB161399 TaxID=2720392 RepID=UPI00155783DE|nr:xanthine dehydrogenase family protein subunit M [Mangrovicoccus sp. HB161399]